MKSSNPIIRVDGVALPAPTSYVWGLQDISKEGSGRSEDLTMSKARVGQVRSLDLKWEKVRIPEAAVILRAFNPEYITVRYLDAMAGGFVTEEFFVGDRNAPLFDTKNGRWESIEFTITTKGGCKG